MDAESTSQTAFNPESIADAKVMHSRQMTRSWHCMWWQYRRMAGPASCPQAKRYQIVRNNIAFVCATLRTLIVGKLAVLALFLFRAFRPIEDRLADE